MKNDTKLTETTNKDHLPTGKFNKLNQYRFKVGHKTNVKWTPKRVIKKLSEAIQYLNSNEKEYTLAGTLLNVGLYKQWFSDVVYSNYLKPHKDLKTGIEIPYNKRIAEHVNVIISILESRIINTGLETGTSQALRIFILKNKPYNYEDKRTESVELLPTPIELDSKGTNELYNRTIKGGDSVQDIDFTETEETNE